jgi:hypothetical protein
VTRFFLILSQLPQNLLRPTRSSASRFVSKSHIPALHSQIQMYLIRFTFAAVGLLMVYIRYYKILNTNRALLQNA